MIHDPRIAGLLTLVRAALAPPSGAGRITLALGLGVLCHTLFAVAVLAMIVAMFFGLGASVGTFAWPWAILANAALIVQFPLGHCLLLTGRGGRLLARLIPGPHGATLATTTYAMIATAQLLALFALWTPPVWTPDQLALAVCYTACCLLAPHLKERRFATRYGDRFARYRVAVPYAVPRQKSAKDSPDAQ